MLPVAGFTSVFEALQMAEKIAQSTSSLTEIVINFINIRSYQRYFCPGIPYWQLLKQKKMKSIKRNIQPCGKTT